MGVSQNEAAGTGSVSQGSVSQVCFVVCFGGLFHTVLLPRTVKFKGSVSQVCFVVCFGGLFHTVLLPRTVKFKGSVSQVCRSVSWYVSGSVSPKSNFPASLKVAPPKKIQTQMAQMCCM